MCAGCADNKCGDAEAAADLCLSDSERKGALQAQVCRCETRPESLTNQFDLLLFRLVMVESESYILLILIPRLYCLQFAAYCYFQNYMTTTSLYNDD